MPEDFLVENPKALQLFLYNQYPGSFENTKIVKVERSPIGASGDNFILTIRSTGGILGKEERYFASFPCPTAGQNLSQITAETLDAILEGTRSVHRNNKLPKFIQSRKGPLRYTTVYFSSDNLKEETVEKMALYEGRYFQISPYVENGEYGDLNNTTAQQAALIGKYHAQFLQSAHDALGHLDAYEGKKTSYNKSNPAHFTGSLSDIIYSRYKQDDQFKVLRSNIDLTFNSYRDVLAVLEALKKKTYEEIIEDKSYQDLVRIMDATGISIHNMWEKKVKATRDTEKRKVFSTKVTDRAIELHKAYTEDHHLAKIIVGLKDVDDVVSVAMNRPMQVVHGDPNPANFKFSENDVELFGDLNELPVLPVLFDVGNAWANMGRRVKATGLVAENFEAYTTSFVEHAGELLSDEARALIEQDPHKVLIVGSMSFLLNRLRRESNPNLDVHIIMKKMTGPTSAQYSSEYRSLYEEVAYKNMLKNRVDTSQPVVATESEIGDTGGDKSKGDTPHVAGYQKT